MKKMKGFTLIELMVVISIIGILAAISVPQYQGYIHRSEITEALSMVGSVRENVAEYYLEHISFPADNAAAGVPQPQFLIGNRITGVLIEDGAIHVTMGNKASKPLQGKTLTFRPAVVIGSPTSPIAWLCGYDTAVSGMQAVGVNNTDLPSELLPGVCRKR